MADCLFCRIAAKQLSSHAIYESGEVFAFLDINPRAPGHTVVVPKRHAADLVQLPESGIIPLVTGVREVIGLLERGIHPAGFTIGVNHGRGAGAEVDHLHIHVIPRFEGDAGKSIQAVVSNPPAEPLEVIAKKIREA